MLLSLRLNHEGASSSYGGECRTRDDRRVGVSGICHRTASETLHTADDVLVGSKVRYLSNFSAALHFGERPESALSSRWLTTRRMGEDAS